MWIDTDLGSSCTEVALPEFPSGLVLQEKTFTLMVVIAFQRGLTQDALGHYVAYLCVWEMYDDLGSRVKAASQKTQSSAHMLCSIQSSDCLIVAMH